MGKRDISKFAAQVCLAAFFALAIMAGLSGCGARHVKGQAGIESLSFSDSWGSRGGTVIQDIEYDAARHLRYDLYLPDEENRVDCRGAMLMIHGGAWCMGSKEAFASHCRRFARQGYLTATMDYRLCSEKKPVTFSDMLDDIGACLQNFKERADAEGYPVCQVALSGASAGGHLAMLYAYTRSETSPLEIAFVFQMVGPAIFEPGTWGEMEDNIPTLISLAAGVPLSKEAYLKGGKAMVKPISPALNITPSTVPTICAYGGVDTVVPPSQRDRLVEELEKNHVPYRLIDYAASGHGLENDAAHDLEYNQAVMEFAQRYFKRK